jgi:hypothetical protein
LAWLHATPKEAEKSRQSSFQEFNPNLIEFPSVDGLETVIGHFHESGRVSYTGMGITPLTWQEMASWASTTNLLLPTWEILVIREMSMAYVAEYNQASDPLREAPYRTEGAVISQREKVAKDLSAAFKLLKRD